MTDAELAELEALSEACSHPWRPCACSIYAPCPHRGLQARWCDGSPPGPTVELAVKARNALPALLAEVRRLRAELEARP